MMPADEAITRIERDPQSASYQRTSPWGIGFDRNPLPMWVEEDGTRGILAVNDAALARYGYSRAEFLALAVSDLQADETAEGVEHHRRADGTSVPVKVERDRIDVDGRPAWLAVVSERDDQAIRDSEERFRQMFEVACDGFWETDRKGRMTVLSPSYEASFGLSVENILGKRLQDFPGVSIHPEMAEKALVAIQRLEPFRDFVYSRRHVTTNKVRWVHTNCVPLLSKSGAVAGYRGVARDISAQIEAEQALRASEQRFRQMFELASDFYWEMDAKFRYRLASPRWDALHGIGFDEIRGKRLIDFPGVSITPEMGKMALVAQKARQPFRDFVYSRKLGTGETRWFSVCGMPSFDETGEFSGYQGVGTDITRRIEAELAAGLAQRSLHDAVNYVSQPLVVYDAKDCAVAFNGAFVDLHRRDDGKFAVFLGAAFSEMAEWQIRSGFYQTGTGQTEIDLDTLLARHLTEDEHSYLLGDGRWMLVTYRHLPGGGRVGLWTDITAVKRAEGETRRLQEQLHHSQRLEGLGTLAGGAAHEINNALVPVIALTKIVATHLPEESRDRRSLGLVLRGAERSRDLVKQILDFSRKEEHRRETVDVAAVLKEALQLLRVTVPSTIRFEEDIAQVPLVIGDPNQIHQVIVNLVANAAHAIGEAQGTITTGLHLDAVVGRLCLSVADTGCGMTEATRIRIFEPFFTTKEVGKGTGLGLAVVHGIITSHGGSIEVESAPGQGTRFAVYLPVARTQAAD
jgi:PAS domain S-box-containing protein